MGIGLFEVPINLIARIPALTGIDAEVRAASERDGTVETCLRITDCRSDYITVLANGKC